MRVSQRLDYTVRFLVALAAVPSGRTVAAGDLAEGMGMPRRFLEQQMTTLGKAGIVECRRGTGGGCVLARPAETITMADIVRAVQGDILDVPHQQSSAASEFWETTALALTAYCQATTLADLMRRQMEIDTTQVAMYYI